VLRILDQGTGAGQLATSLKKRFPEAEVWGIDIGGPMVRYAHMRANDIGSNINFAQRLAEDSKFPDHYFDIITSTQMHHEATAEASQRIFAEAHRTLRPGGVFFPGDTVKAPRELTAFGMLKQYVNYRWNHEDWWMEWFGLDHGGELRGAGFVLDQNTVPGRIGGYVARKV